MNNDIRILAWNPNGLLRHQQELQLLLNNQKIDVCLISETHFTNQTHMTLKGYTIYHTIHPDNTARGGSAIIVKNNILHYEQGKYQTKEIQATTVSVKTKNYLLSIAAIYCPPRYNLKKENYSLFFKSIGENFIVGGDFNAKHTFWGSRLITTRGSELLKAVTELGCNCHSTGKPTYWPTDVNKTPDLLDFFITRKLPLAYAKLEEGFDSSSDHSSILLTLSDKIIVKENKPSLTNRHTDWEGFKYELNNRIKFNVLLSSEERLDKELEKFIIDIQQSAWNNTPKIKRRAIGNNYPKEIRILVAEKRKARKTWQHSRSPESKNKLNNLTQRLRRELNEIRNDTVNSYLRSLTYDKSTDYSLWKATKKLKNPITQIPPIRTTIGTFARSDECKADAFAEFLENIFQPNKEQKYNRAEIVAAQAAEEQQIAMTTCAKVAKEIRKNTSAKKAPGFDLITGEILKQLPKKGIIKLTTIINAAIRLKYVPQLWKFAEVIMVPKPGKPPNDISSYRPISLLPVMSKLFEKIFLKQIKSIIERRNLIPSHQFGFRDKHSTIDQVHRITNIIEKSLEEKQTCSTIFLDVAQAFDKVWHEGLMQKIEKILPSQFCKLIESYITGRYFRVKQEQTYSAIRTISAGVPQGSVLEPVLYLLYTSDIPHENNTTIATFADDTAIMAVGATVEESTAKLQTAINKINEWTKQWRIRLNESKSVHVNYTNKKEKNLPVVLNNVPIPYANSAKYLGMNLDAKLRWKVHVKKKNEELRIKYRKMQWLMGKNSQLKIHNKLMLYKQILKPIWTYGIELWGCTKPSNQKIIQKFQNRVLRDIVKAPWYVRNSDIHRDLGMEKVANEARRFAQKHEFRLLNHPNIEATKLLDYEETIRRLKRVKPHELI